MEFSAHIFVASVGESSQTYAASPSSETMADWLTAAARALASCSGLPQLIWRHKLAWTSGADVKLTQPAIPTAQVT